MLEVVKIGTQLRAARERALLTQEELAARAEVQPLTISRIETDKVEPGTEPSASWPRRSA